jgi:hypothetical protein
MSVVVHSQNVFLYEIKNDLLSIYAAAKEPIFLGSISTDVSSITMQSFIDDMVFKYSQYVFVPPKHTSADLFLADGRPRYVSITGHTNNFIWHVRIPNKKPLQIPYRGNLEADVVYIAQKISLAMDICDTSISFIVLKTAISEMAKNKVLR